LAYIKISDARAAAQAAPPTYGTAQRVLASEARNFNASSHYDIFLSHSSSDAEIIYGLKKIIEKLGLTVYVDWIDDAELDRSKVTVKTAAVLRERMKACSSLVYVHSTTSPDSVWMPWELGYFDGLRKNHVWVLPLVTANDGEYRQQEYLGLYPTIEKLSELIGKNRLGFTKVGDDDHTVLLEDAVSKFGVFMVGG
jgi:hypothetical protein